MIASIFFLNPKLWALGPLQTPQATLDKVCFRTFTGLGWGNIMMFINVLPAVYG